MAADREQAGLDKAPDAFRTISEVAEDLDVPQHVLRFWESRFNQIKPMKRGGGRRYYRPEDVELLRGIRHLLYGEGYTIRGVQRILRDQGVKFVQAVWQEGAAQPPHKAGAELEEPVLEETEAEDEEENAGVEEAAEAEAEETPRRGVFGRIPALFGREAEESEIEEPPARREPAMTPPSGQTPATPAAAPSFAAQPAMPRRPSFAMPSIDNMTAPNYPGPSYSGPGAAAPSAPTAMAGLSREDTRRLQAALHELIECRRLIDATFHMP